MPRTVPAGVDSEPPLAAEPPRPSDLGLEGSATEAGTVTDRAVADRAATEAMDSKSRVSPRPLAVPVGAAAAAAAPGPALSPWQ